MKDWKGNRVKAGDVIVEIKTAPLFNSSQMCIIQDGKIAKIGEAVHYPEHIWQIVGEYPVEEVNGKLYITDRMFDTTIHFNIDYDWPMNNIICIKGVSDNQEEYYLNFFKS